MYADDTTVYCIGPNVDQVMLSLNKSLELYLLQIVKIALSNVDSVDSCISCFEYRLNEVSGSDYLYQYMLS